MTIDVNADGEIQLTEAQNVYIIDVSNSSISDVAGISNFVNLKGLNCSYNQLTSLTIDSSIKIWMLNASHNLLNSIDVAFRPSVEGINLSYNNITSFALDNCTNWETLNLSHNQLSSLEFDNVSIAYLNVSHNSLSDIQFNGNFSLFSSADFTHNQFTLLDLSDIEST